MSSQERLMKQGLVRRTPLALRLLLGRLARLRIGSLEVDLPGGGRRRFEGPEPGPGARLVIRDPGMAGRVLLRGGLGFAEGYMAGEWDTPDLAGLLVLLDRNQEALGGGDGGSRLARLADLVLHRLRRNTRAGARRHIAAHYDLGNDFYRAWLDESMTYSCALFEREDQPLADAQYNKYRSMLARLAPGPEDHLLEIGCGWGGFAIHAARETGCRVTGLTLSTAQLTEARARAAAAGVADRVEFRLQDYRDVTERFDHVVSIEMFEAVGEAYWPVFFRCLRERLRPGGRAAVQVITIDHRHFQRYRRGVDFIQRYIFPGGMLPSPEIFTRQAARAGLLARARSFHGADYARTLACWDRKLFAARRRLLEQGFDEGFLRMWHYYLAYCQAGFRNGKLDLLQLTLEPA